MFLFSMIIGQFCSRYGIFKNVLGYVLITFSCILRVGTSISLVISYTIGLEIFGVKYKYLSSSPREYRHYADNAIWLRGQIYIFGVTVEKEIIL